MRAYVDLQATSIIAAAAPFLHLFDPPQHDLNEYNTRRRRLGLPHRGLRPADLREASSRGAMVAAAGIQSGSDLHRSGWPRLVPPGLGDRGHLQRALQIHRHPFDTDSGLNDDLITAVDMSAQSGPSMVKWRNRRMRYLAKKAAELEPLDEALKNIMSPRIRMISEGARPAFVLYLSILLGHPDVLYTTSSVYGFDVVGEIEAPPIFRPTFVAPDRTSVQSLLDTAPEFIDRLERDAHDSRSEDVDRAMMQQCQKEVDRGFSPPPASAADLDAIYGQGRWRPLRRFVLNQGDTFRAIDDGLFAGHNQATILRVRVHTVDVAMVASVARRYFKHLPALQTFANEADGHVLFVGGTDDEKSAYRWRPVSDKHAGLTVVAYWDYERRRVRYLQLIGHPFGLSAAVVSYNRGPELLTAAARRILSIPTAHFYDDHLVLGTSLEKSSGQKGLRLLAKLTGTQFDDTKHKDMRPAFVFIGCFVNAWAAFSDLILLVLPKRGRAESIKELMPAHMRRGRLTAAEAATLRGKTSFAGSQLTGRAMRGCERALIKREHADSSTAIDDNLLLTFEFIASALDLLPPRRIHLTHVASRRPLILYSDAEYTVNKPMGFGFLVFAPWLARPLGGFGVVPDDLTQQFETRMTQIAIGETLAAISAFYSVPELFQNVDILHFVDNQSALASIISGSSKAEDIGAIACLYHLILGARGSRSWLEYVESSANLSDGLSRMGERWCRTKLASELGAVVRPAVLPALPCLRRAPLAELIRLFT